MQLIVQDEVWIHVSTHAALLVSIGSSLLYASEINTYILMGSWVLTLYRTNATILDYG